MFIQLKHKSLDVYEVIRELIKETYMLSLKLPADEKFNMVQQIRRAAISVHLNLAEGCSRRSQNERNRYFEIARGSIIEIDSAIGIAFKLEYTMMEELKPLGESIVKTFKLLSGMIKRDVTHN